MTGIFFKFAFTWYGILYVSQGVDYPLDTRKFIGVIQNIDFRVPRGSRGAVTSYKPSGSLLPELIPVSAPNDWNFFNSRLNGMVIYTLAKGWITPLDTRKFIGVQTIAVHLGERRPHLIAQNKVACMERRMETQ